MRGDVIRVGLTLTVAAIAMVGGVRPVAAGAQPVTAALRAAVEAQAAVPMPPDGSPPVVRNIVIAFPAQGNVPSIEPQTYLYYIEMRGSRPSEDVWLPYDEQRALGDFRRLWETGFLDDLSIEVSDEPYPNGVIGRTIVYNMEERERVRIVEFNGSEELDRVKIEEALTQSEAAIGLDTFLDTALIKKVKTILRIMLAEAGYNTPVVTHEVEAVAGGPKRVRLVFTIEDGPETRIRAIEFTGNEAIGAGALRKQMTANKEPKIWPLSWFSSHGTYREHRFAEDADGIIQHYRKNGYVRAQVGQPVLTTLEDSEDGKKRFVRMRIPVSEGRRYRLGDLTLEGITIVREEALRTQFDLVEGDYYDDERIRRGIERAQAQYGAGGYMEFVAFPDLSPRDEEEEADGSVRRTDGPAIVDVTIRAEEGEQYLVNRIEFAGNTTTRDNVIRREIRVFEGGIFNTEMLKVSVRRLNQLGYFMPLEEDAVEVEKSEGDENRVDLMFPLEEQNRNQITFGAGVSQFDGFFGQLSFGTSNFLGRGETMTVSMQGGSRTQNFVFGFTEPFLFDRNISAGFTLFKTKLQYIGLFTQASVGSNVTFGVPLANFTRMFLSYGYEEVTVSELNPLFTDPRVLQNNPFLQDSLLIGQDGRRTVSRITPSFIHNTIDNPVFPNSGKRFVTAFEFAGLGGNTNFYKPRFEGIWYFQTGPRTSVGLRAETEYIAPFGDTEVLPLFERLFLGGEFSIRGFDLRTVGPRDARTGLVLGGNKSLLFNGEYLITIAQPVRLIFFYDTGQVQDRGTGFTIGDFKTSTGGEVRFMMPVMGVPFRLIFAYNPHRSGVLDNSFRPESAFNFRFAIGSSF